MEKLKQICYLGYEPEETKLINKTIEIALEKGIIEAKNKIIVDSTHTNAIFHYISPREELIIQAKELRKSVYKIDESMHDKIPQKRESSGLLENQMEYTKELLEIIREDGRLDSLSRIKELICLIEKSQQTRIEVEAIIGDAAYSEKENLDYCQKNNIKNVSKLSSIVTHRRKNENIG